MTAGEYYKSPFTGETVSKSGRYTHLCTVIDSYVIEQFELYAFIIKEHGVNVLVHSELMLSPHRSQWSLCAGVADGK